MISTVTRFRVWLKKRKSMVYFDFENCPDYYTLRYHVCDGDPHYSIEFDNSEDEKVYYGRHEFDLMRSIGREDKNRKMIFEGDIVRIDDRDIGDSVVRVGTVYFCTDYTLESNPSFACWGVGGHFRLSPSAVILGNGLENSDLLERFNIGWKNV